MSTPGFHKSEIFELLPNVLPSPTARDVFAILTVRQETNGLVRIRQRHPSPAAAATDHHVLQVVPVRRLRSDSRYRHHPATELRPAQA